MTALDEQGASAPPAFVDADGHVIPASQLPLEVRDTFKKMLYRKAPLFVNMKKLLSRELQSEKAEARSFVDSCSACGGSGLAKDQGEFR